MHKYTKVYCTSTAYHWYQTINAIKRLRVYIAYITSVTLTNIYHGSRFVIGKYLDYFITKQSVKTHLVDIPNGITQLQTLIADIELVHRNNNDATLASIPTFDGLLKMLTNIHAELTAYMSELLDADTPNKLGVASAWVLSPLLTSTLPHLREFSDTNGPVIELTYRFFCDRIAEHCPVTRMLSNTIDYMSTLLDSLKYITSSHPDPQHTQIMYIKQMHRKILVDGYLITPEIMVANYPKMDLYDIIPEDECYQQTLRFMMKRNINGVPYRYDTVAMFGPDRLIRGITRDDYSRDSLVDEYFSNDEDSDA